MLIALVVGVGLFDCVADVRGSDDDSPQPHEFAIHSFQFRGTWYYRC